MDAADCELRTPRSTTLRCVPAERNRSYRRRSVVVECAAAPTSRALMTDPGPHHFHGAFGKGAFGQTAERFARFFGTPRFILGQTVLVAVWIALNAAAFSFRWDPYPFILLNLAFSTQAAYAAPLILLAQTRQADRDKMREDMFQHHREEEAARTAHYEPSRRRCSLKTATSPNSRQRCQDSTPSCSARTRRLPNESHASPTSSTRPCSGIAGRRPNPGARSVQPVCVGNGFCRDLAGIL